MGPAGTLFVDLALNVARMQADMDAVRGTIDRGMSGIEGTVNKVKGAFAALGVTVSAGAFVTLVKNSIDATAALHDLAITTGMSVENLSAFRDIGAQSGASIDKIAGMSVKLSKALAVSNEETAGATQAIKALGLNYEDFRKMKPDEQMVAIAKAMDNYADGAGKSAVATTLFGRSGAEQLPFLKDLARTTELNASVTKEQAAAADELGDRFAMLGVEGRAWVRDVSLAMLPALNDAAGAFLDVVRGVDETGKATDKLKNQASITSWTETAVRALTYVIDIFGVLQRTVVSVIEFFSMLAAKAVTLFGGLADGAKRALAGDFKGAVEAVSSSMERSDEISRAYGERLKEIWGSPTLGKQIRDRIELNKQNTKATEEGDKAQLKFNARVDEAAKAAAKQSAATTKLIDDLRKQATEANAAAGQTEDLTAAQKLEIDVMAKLNSSTERYTDAQKAAVIAELKATQAAIEGAEAAKVAREAREAVKKTMDGKTAEELARLEISRLKEASATRIQQAAVLDSMPGLEKEAAWYREQGELLGKLAEEKEKGVHVQAAVQAKEAWEEVTKSIYEGMTDAIYRSVSEGKNLWESLVSTIKGMFSNLVLQPLIRGVMGPVSGAMGGMMSGVGSALAGTSPTGGGGGGSGMIGQIGQLGGLTGVGSIFGSGLVGGIGAWASGIGSAAGTFLGGASAVGSGIMGGSLGATMAGLGTALGAALPVLAAVYALYKGFSRGPKIVKERGIEGEAISGDTTAQLYEKWKQKGGWIVGDRKGTRYKDLPEEISSALDEATVSVYGQVTEWTKALGLPAEKLAEVTHSLSIKYGKDDAETQKNIEEAMDKYREVLAQKFADFLEPFRNAGETLVETLQRLVAIQQVTDQLNSFGGIFSKIAALSVEAKEELISFAGGIENLISKVQSFVGTYYSAEEQSGIAARNMVEALTALGIDPSNLITKNDFRSIVEGTDVGTTEGRKLLNSLLDLAPGFAQLADVLGKDGGTLLDLAAKAPQTELLRSMFEQTKTTEELQLQTAVGVEQVNSSVLSIGDTITAAISDMKNEVVASLVSVATATAATTRQLERWDDNGALATTVIP